MPTNVVSMDNMRKHLTKTEKAERIAAENKITRSGNVRLAEPKAVRDDPEAHAYWNSIKKRLKGINLLDDVDSDMLGIYCQLLARRDRMLGDDKMSKFELQLIQAQERLIAMYAEKLGLTPNGRARLTKKEAEKPKENKFEKFKK